MGNKDLIISGNVLTFDEFKKRIDSLDAKTIFDRASDLYDRIPSFIRTIQNFDPTGIAGAIDQALSENKARREKENVVKALYAFYEAVIYVGNKVSMLQTSIKEQMPDLTYLYFRKSQEVYDTDKINYYRNIWVNGVIRTEDTFEEKAYVFEVISSLSTSEISVMAYMETKQGNVSFEERKPISINEITTTMKSSVQQAQQICIGLAGKGLLHDYRLGRFDYQGPRDFVITDYVLLIARYLKAP